jgi:hypothetical protein
MNKDGEHSQMSGSMQRSLIILALALFATIGSASAWAIEILRAGSTTCNKPGDNRVLQCHTKAHVFIETTSEFYGCNANFDGLKSADLKTVVRAEVQGTCVLWMTPFNAAGDYVGGMGEYLNDAPTTPILQPNFGWAFSKSGKHGRVCFASTGGFPTVCGDVNFR